jgi:HAD superfamily phosphatase (TIGR01668 family)
VYSILKPDWHLDSILELEASHLRARGLRGLLLDVDGTLKDHRAPGFSDDILAWARGLREGGISLCLLSNGKRARIEALAGVLGVDGVALALKPLPFGCRLALRKLGLRPDQAALAGDQLFADVLAGRLARVFTILVRPTSMEEPWFTRLKRPLERHVLRRAGLSGNAPRR